MMLTSEDKFEIGELIARFAHCSDYGDWTGLESLYAPEIVTEIEGLEWKYEGIAAQIDEAKESVEQSQGQNRHSQFNLIIEEVGEDVFASFYTFNVHAGSAPMGAQILFTLRHRDRVVKTLEGWKFAHRVLTLDQNVT